MNDAVLEPALVEQFELRSDAVRQGAFAATHHDRAYEEKALVDQPGADRLAGEVATRDRDVGRRGQLQLSDRLRSNSRSIRVLALDGV